MVWFWVFVMVLVRWYVCSWPVMMMAPSAGMPRTRAQPISSPLPPTCILFWFWCQLQTRQMWLSLPKRLLMVVFVSPFWIVAMARPRKTVL